MDGSQVELVEVGPELLERWLKGEGVDQGGVVLVDVREDFEHAVERIDGAINRPLSMMDMGELRREIGDRRVVFHCRSGKRSEEAAMSYGDEQVFHLSGGILNWKQSGRGVIASGSGPRIDVIRQVHMCAGFLIVLGVVLGHFVHAGFVGLSAFVGCGLMFAGVTGWCGMGILLGKMPWNRVRGLDGNKSCSSSGSCHCAH